MTNPDDEVIVEQSIAAALAGFDPYSRAGSSAPIGGAIVNWRTLDDENAAFEWNRLHVWVQWFTIRYDVPLSTVPDCWHRHSALVEELSALHSAHLASFHSSDTGYGPLAWHERLSLALPRLTRAYGGGCTTGHRSLKPRTWPDREHDQEWQTWITQTHAP